MLLLSALIVALDRWSKIWVGRHIEEGSAITVIPRYFRITHVENPGAAFSLFTETAHPERTHWLLTGFSIFAAVVVLVVLLRIGRRLSVASLALALILGGAIGNVWDRLRYLTVTDFLEVHLRWGAWSYHWPDFNVADSAIVTGGILLLLDALMPVKKKID
nr:signal peptidase II [Paracidobacterium acidisoli]